MHGRAPRGRAGRALLALALLATALSGCASRGGAQASLEELRADEAMPLFWRVDSDRGATLYLLGGVHLGPPGGWILPPAVEWAFEESTALVVEVDPDEITGTRMQFLVGRYGMLPAGVRLQDRVSPETWAALQRQVARTRLPAAAIDRMRPWLVGNLLVNDATRRLGLTTRGGVDVAFVARRGERSVVPLESADYQLSLLAGLPADLQELALRDTVSRYEDVDDYVSELVDTWRTGNEEALETFFFASREETPGYGPFYEIMVDRRNHEMAERLRVLLNAEQHRGEIVFVVVGAGHVIGREGIPSILATWGFDVTQLHRDELMRPIPPGGAIAGHP